MKQFLLVLKLFLKNAFAFKRKQNEKMKTPTKVLIAFGLGFTYLSILAILISVAVVATPIFQEKGLLNEFLVVCYVAVGILVLIFGALHLLNVLFFSKDNEFFLTLPMRSSTIFIAKFTFVYVIELMIAVALLLPMLIAIAVVAKLSAFFYCMMPIVVLLTPALPLLLSSILMIPLMYVVTFFKNRKAFTSIFAILFFGLAYGVYFFFIFNNAEEGSEVNIPAIIESLRGTLVTLSNVLYPFLALARLTTLSQAFGQDVAMSALINAVIFIVSCVALVGLTMFLSNLIYKTAATGQIETQKRKSSGKVSESRNSQLKALIKKEWKDTIRNPSFAFQSLAGVIITPLLIVMLSVNLRGSLTLDAGDVQFNFNYLMWYIGLGLVVMLGIGMNFFASTAITREGKNFYFSKMMPVPYKTQAKAKVILSSIISLAATVPSLIIMSITLNEYILLVPSLIFTTAYSVGFNCLAVYVDLTKPKLDWTTSQQAMKQNFRASIPYLINSAISGGIFLALPIVFTIILKPLIAGLIIWTINFLFAGLIVLVFSSILSGHVDKCYESLSV